MKVKLKAIHSALKGGCGIGCNRTYNEQRPRVSHMGHFLAWEYIVGSTQVRSVISSIIIYHIVILLNVAWRTTIISMHVSVNICQNTDVYVYHRDNNR